MLHRRRSIPVSQRKLAVSKPPAPPSVKSATSSNRSTPVKRVDDYHRGVFLVGRTAVDAVKGTHNHLKTKKQYKLEKASYS